MIGRTHGLHAEPMTFGLKLAVWYAEVQRDIERVERARTGQRLSKRNTNPAAERPIVRRHPREFQVERCETPH